VEGPEEGDSVEEVMGAPFEEILEDEEDDELRPDRPGGDEVELFGLFDDGVNPDEEILGEEGYGDACIVSIEDEPKEVLCELTAELSLFGAPRGYGFEDHAAG